MRKTNKQKQFMHGGNTFVATAKDGKVQVRVQKTAHGQKVLVGVFHISDQRWQNDNGKFPLPTSVRREVETHFAPRPKTQPPSKSPRAPKPTDSRTTA